MVINLQLYLIIIRELKTKDNNMDIKETYNIGKHFYIAMVNSDTTGFSNDDDVLLDIWCHTQQLKHGNANVVLLPDQDLNNTDNLTKCEISKLDDCCVEVAIF